MAALYSSSHTTHTPRGGTKFVIKWRVKLYPIIPTRNDARRRHFFPPEQKKTFESHLRSHHPRTQCLCRMNFHFNWTPKVFLFWTIVCLGCPKLTHSTVKTHIFIATTKRTPFFSPFVFPFSHFDCLNKTKRNENLIVFHFPPSSTSPLLVRCDDDDDDTTHQAATCQTTLSSEAGVKRRFLLIMRLQLGQCHCTSSTHTTNQQTDKRGPLQESSTTASPPTHGRKQRRRNYQRKTRKKREYVRLRPRPTQANVYGEEQR